MAHKTHKGCVVIVDDEVEIREVLAEYLSDLGFVVQTYPSGVAAFAATDKGDFTIFPLERLDLVITDLSMPEMSGLELMERMKKRAPEVPVILATAHGSIETAIEATRRGVYDYVVKPLKLSELAATVERAVNLRRLKQENSVLRGEIKKNWSLGEMLGKSKAMEQVFDLVERVAKASANVLITGESGTGKEMVARAIHQRGPRANKPFVAINCSAIPANLLESELFGHAKGSFTGAVQAKRGLFEEANGGTIFLDEIGDMDMALQAKLLRVIQERKIKPVGDNIERDIDVRILAATHKDLKLAIKEERFREDLYYRLSVIPVVLPPLRHRREDIPLLAGFFLQKYAATNASVVKGFTPEALGVLINARWEGNVRELENIVERVVVLSASDWIRADEVPVSESESIEDFFGGATADLPTLTQLERRYMQLVLDKTGGKKEKAAHILGINRRTLYRKEREYGFVEADPAQEAAELGEDRADH